MDSDYMTRWGTSGEWVQDWYGSLITDAVRNSTQGPGQRGVSRDARRLFSRTCQGAGARSSRYIQKPNVRSIVIGCRCVRELVL